VDTVDGSHVLLSIWMDQARTGLVGVAETVGSSDGKCRLPQGLSNARNAQGGSVRSVHMARAGRRPPSVHLANL